ncbi:MAG: (Fe-S)-binding protein [Dehalococcoidia bacterium]|nr:(Fe-S)-binding protein [Dehalococcoidia bacterium]
MVNKNFFDASCCRLCGTCLSSCPVLNFSPVLARAAKDKLNKGLDSGVLDSCTTCFSCNSYCPNNCHPYELILLRWHERYLRLGLPAIARMVIPGDISSIWSQLYPLLPTDEKDQIRNWRNMEGKQGKDILLTGCFSSFSPYLADNSLLTDLTIYGDERLWCSGGHIYQLGLLDVVEKAGLRVKKVLEDLRPRRIVTMMAAEHAMLTIILPEKFGIHINSNVITLEQWLLQQLHSGSLSLITPIRRRIAIHDNCFSKSEGDTLWRAAREIASACGADLVEMPHNCRDSLCCGFGAAAGKFSLLDLIEHGSKRLKEAERSGADCLVTYCSACYFIFSVVRELYGSRLELYHLLELVEMARGNKPLHRTRQRAFQIIAIITANILRMGFNDAARRRFYIDLSLFERELSPDDIGSESTRLLKFLDTLYSSVAFRNIVTLGILHFTVRLIIYFRRGLRHDGSGEIPVS